MINTTKALYLARSALLGVAADLDKESGIAKRRGQHLKTLAADAGCAEARDEYNHRAKALKNEARRMRERSLEASDAAVVLDKLMTAEASY